MHTHAGLMENNFESNLENEWEHVVDFRAFTMSVMFSVDFRNGSYANE